MKHITLLMHSDNIDKIIAGVKTTTVRSPLQYIQIGLSVSETGIWSTRGKDFLITNKGYLTIEEAGGIETILKSEGVNSINQFGYKQTKEWVNGNGRLYVYSIQPYTKEN